MSRPVRSPRSFLKTALGAGAALALLGGVAACSYNETLGRDQIMLVDEAALVQASNAAWAETLKTNRVSRDPALNRRLQAVAPRIIQAAGLTDRRWEYVVFEGDQPNAFVLPGGQIGVTTALFRVARTDDQLAAVIGHEVAHVVARHAAERYSQTSLAQLGVGLAQQAATGSDSEAVRAAAAYGGVGAQVGFLLPFSRQHELEADRIGVDYMARAGFRPAEALALWRNMAANRTGGAAPQFLSTHPSDETRLRQLEEYMRSKGYLR